MPIKIIAGIVAVALMTAYLVPMVLKIKDISLAVVVLIGVAFMVIDLLHSLRKRED